MIHDLLIIGAGPAGISLAVEAISTGMESQKVVLIEQAKEHSYSIRKFYPESKPVTANYKGMTASCDGVMCLTDTTKEGVLSLLDQVIEQNNIHVNYQENVSKLERTEEGLLKIESNKAIYFVRACVIAVGVLGRPNKPDYKIPSSLKGLVHFDVTSKEIKGSKVLVVGGGDSASEYVQYLVQKGNEVSLSYRRSEFNRMNDINQQSLENLNIQNKAELLLSTTIESLVEQDGKVKVNFSNETSKTYDHVMYALGGSTPDNFLKSIGIQYDGPVPQLTSEFETSINGLFLIGDLSAGKKGGSIISAFNSSYKVMQEINNYYMG